MRWLFWPVSVAGEVAALAPCRRPLSTTLAVICCLRWLSWPVSVAVLSRIGRYLLSEVAVLACIGGRYQP